MSHKQYEVTMKASEPSTVNLRAMEPCDIDAIYRWENDPSVWGVSMSHQPFSRYALSRFIDENSGSDIYASRQLRLMADSGGTTVGCIDLYDFDPYHRRAGVGLLVDSRMRCCRRQRGEHCSFHQGRICTVRRFARLGGFGRQVVGCFVVSKNSIANDKKTNQDSE